MPKNALVPIADGTEEMEAVCTIDVLRRAGVSVTVASVANLQVTASRGTKLVADCLINECCKTIYDIIVLPGGMPGAEHLRDSESLVKMLKQQQKEGRLYAAICASPAVVLQHHGLIGPKKATCYPSFRDKLANPAPLEQSVVVDGTCITSCGPGTAMDFALKLVEILFDKKKAGEISAQMLYQSTNN